MELYKYRGFWEAGQDKLARRLHRTSDYRKGSAFYHQ